MAEKMDIDMSLDDIIRNNRGKFRSQLRGNFRGRSSRGFIRGANVRRSRGYMRQSSARGKFTSLGV